ncbi:hypothetical protein vseg_012276 [Gypsophila vaccaria]
MDLEEWEVLSDEGIIDLHENDQKISNNNNNNNISPKFKSKNIYTDYFQTFEDDDHQEMIPNENQFVDTKIVEVCSHVCADEQLARLFCKPAVEDSTTTTTETTETDPSLESLKGVKNEGEEGKLVEVEKKVKEGEKMGCKRGEKGVWKWAMNGMGALVSFGVVLASVSFIAFTNQHKHNMCSNKNQELHFQFYSHDKRFKQVMRRAKRLNEAISVMRGAPLTTAHITVGGYYEAL